MRIIFFEIKDWERAFLADLLGSEYVSMDRLLAESDMVTLHCPLTPQTPHLLGGEQFARMSREALVHILEVTLANLEAFRAGQPVREVASG